MSGRIGKVRMKATGFEFRVITGAADPETDFGARLLKCAREIATDEGLAGYVVVGLTEDGGYRCGFRWDAERSPIPRTLFPAYMAEVFRRELVTGPEAEEVFDSKFEWVEG
jgi:hypothetical protein